MRETGLSYIPSRRHASLALTAAKSARTGKQIKSLDRVVDHAAAPAAAALSIMPRVVDHGQYDQANQANQANTDIPKPSSDGSVYLTEGIRVDEVATITINNSISTSKRRRGSSTLANPLGRRLPPPIEGAKGMSGVRYDLLSGVLTARQLAMMPTKDVQARYKVVRGCAIYIKRRVSQYGADGVMRTGLGGLTTEGKARKAAAKARRAKPS